MKSPTPPFLLIFFSASNGATQVLKMLPAELDQFWFSVAHGNQFSRTLLKLAAFLLLKRKTKQKAHRQPKGGSKRQARSR